MYQKVFEHQTDHGVQSRVYLKNKSHQLVIKGMGKLQEKENAICNALNGNVCKCAHNPDLVLATFNDEFEVKNARSTVNNDKDDTGVKGEVNFEIVVPSPNYFGKNKQNEFAWENFHYEQNPKPRKYNKEKIIVVMDSGLDIKAFQEKEFALFDTTAFNEKLTDCGHENHTHQNLSTPNYGWNFVDDTVDLEDTNLHGTFVTKNLLASLSNSGIDDFQVLPLKVFDGDGRGSFWSIVRAFDYLKKLKEWDDTLDIAVINASFGSLQDDKESFDFSERAMLKTYIDYFKDIAIIVTPAGNEKNNNDFRPHFPSNFASSKTYPNCSSSNLLAVAGHSRYRFAELSDGFEKSSDLGSNYGEKSVHIAAPWKYRLKLMGNKALVDVEGTSFSASYLSARLLDFILEKDTKKRGAKLLEKFMCKNCNELLEFDEFLPLRNGVFLS